MASGSVVIPAHDEARTIARLLDALGGEGDDHGAPASLRLDVVVVCNGCHDATADVARRAAPWAQIVELDEPSKPAALRAGDERATTFPRVYLDADVVIDRAGLENLAERLDAGGLLAIAPTPHYDIEGSSRLLRSHYRLWAALQAGNQAVSGTGVMMVSEAGRRRFDSWPDVIADDFFLDGCFTDAEKTRAPEVSVMVSLPRRFRACISRRARVHQGNCDVIAAGLRQSPDKRGRGVRAVLRSRPSLALDVPAHAIVVISSRVLSLWRRRRGTSGVFFRADDSRPAQG